MTPTDLLDQFVAEARECLERIAQRLLDVERKPDDRDLLNDLFRLVHTLKGNCGLFEFKPLERIFHAGEDLLDQVRGHAIAYSDTIADGLLEAMDYASELIGSVETSGRLPAGCEARSEALASALRRPLAALARRPEDETPSTAVIGSPTTPPAWLARLPEGLAAAGARVALRYVPEPECFFKGEDPWHLVLTLPGLLHLAVQPATPWAAPDDFDCYKCNLDLVLASTASQAEVLDHLRYVRDQIEHCTLPDASAGTDDLPPAATMDAAGGALRTRVARLWLDQLAVLAEARGNPGVSSSVQRVFGSLLACLGDDPGARTASANLPAEGAAAELLAIWAKAHQPLADGGWSATAGAGAPPEAVRGSPAGAAPLSGVQPAGESGSTERGQRTVKVAQEKVDRLMDLIGEVVVAKNALPYLAIRAEEIFGQRELAREIKNQYAVINRIAEDMQRAIMQVRMLPVGTVFQRFNRLVRDISRRLGKDVDLVIVGEETEADKNLIEALADPLIHILRNSLDHGIELPAVRQAAGKSPRGTLRVEARQESDRVILEITDDGAGVDTDRVRAKAVERGLIQADRARSLTESEAVQLVFLPGFSTAETISDLSGRGVGMDVVRSAVERINGSVELTSTRGHGTRIRLSLPLSMAVTNVMMIESAGRRFGVPMDLIAETVRVHREDIHVFKSAQTIVLRGRVVPLQPLNRLLDLDAEPRTNVDGEFALLVLRVGSEVIGLLVDDFHGTSDIILKPLEGILAGLTGFAGTALMGDGSVLMILNPKELL